LIIHKEVSIKANMRKHYTFVAGLMISFLCIYWLSNKINHGKIVDIVTSIDTICLFWAVVLQLISFGVKGIRWGILLMPFKGCRTMLVTKIALIGLMLNNILPGKIGELGRAYLLGNRKDIRKSLVLSTIITERSVDVLVVLFMLIVVSLVTPLSHLAQRIIMYSSFAVFGFFSLLLLVKAKRAKLGFLLEAAFQRRFKRRGEAFIEIIKNLFLGFQWSTYKALALRLSFFSILYWGIICLSTQFIVWGFHLPVPYYVSIVIVGITSFGMIIPSSPGYLGTYHFLVVNTLLFFNVDKNTALSFAILAHSIWYSLEIFLGLTFMWQENLSFEVLKDLKVIEWRKKKV